MTQPIRELFQFGFAMCIGIVLDTLLIRAVMVPAIAQLLGARNWWPGRIREPACGDAAAGSVALPSAGN